MTTRRRLPRHNPRRNMSNAGFTLAEVLIAISILVSITALMWVAISSMFNSRAFFEERAERFQIVRNAMGRMSQELASAYVAGPQHGGEEIPGEERDPTELNEEEAQAAFSREPIQFGMIGKDNRVDFTAFAHVRTQPNELTSHHSEISYFIRRERDDATGEFVEALVRREDTSPDDRLERGGTIFVMIPEVEDVKFEYWDPGQVQLGTLEEIAEGRWITEWDTTRRDFAGRLPSRMRITVTLPGQRDGDDAEKFSTQVQIATTEVLEF